LDLVSLALADLGTRTYTIIMSCPILSHISVSDPQSTIVNNQTSGLIVVQTDLVASNIYLNNFFGLNGLGDVGVPTTRTIQEVYGITGDTSLDGFVYSSNLKMSIVAPAANL
jgi:hypothetical protein